MTARRHGITPGITPGAGLLVQPTGVDKSLVRDTFTAAQGSIHWSVSPLLSFLTAGQKTKLDTSAIQDDGAVFAVNLALYRTWVSAAPSSKTSVLCQLIRVPPS
jgi:hypothetical protein